MIDTSIVFVIVAVILGVIVLSFIRLIASKAQPSEERALIAAKRDLEATKEKWDKLKRQALRRNLPELAYEIVAFLGSKAEFRSIEFPGLVIRGQHSPGRVIVETTEGVTLDATHYSATEGSESDTGHWTTTPDGSGGSTTEWEPDYVLSGLQAGWEINTYVPGKWEDDILRKLGPKAEAIFQERQAKKRVEELRRKSEELKRRMGKKH